MKKTVLLLICALLLLTSCEYVGSIPLLVTDEKEGNASATVVVTEETTTEEETTEETKEYHVLADYYGLWYSYSGAVCFDISESGVKCYALQWGYYEYQSVDDIVSEYDNEEGTLSVTVGETTNSLYFKDGGLLDTSGNEFEAVEELPTEHTTYDFPDLASLTPSDYINYDFTDIADDVALQIRIQKISLYKNGDYDAEKEAGYVILEGDYCNINYEGKLDGVAFEGGTASNVDISAYEGSGYIDGFCAGLIGHKAGETFDVNVTFPETYSNEDLAGKAVVFTMTINKIYDTDTVSDSELEDYQDTIINTALSDCYVSHKADLPETMTEYFVNYYREMYHYYAWYYNMDYDTFLYYYYGVTDEDVVDLGESQVDYILVYYAYYDQLGLPTEKRSDYETMCETLLNAMKETYFGGSEA